MKKVDVLAHVVRMFEDDNVSRYTGRKDPLNDVQQTNHEILLIVRNIFVVIIILTSNKNQCKVIN